MGNKGPSLNGQLKAACNVSPFENNERVSNFEKVQFLVKLSVEEYYSLVSAEKK